MDIIPQIEALFFVSTIKKELLGHIHPPRSCRLSFGLYFFLYQSRIRYLEKNGLIDLQLFKYDDKPDLTDQDHSNVVEGLKGMGLRNAMLCANPI
jgi:hypothetical protein